MTEAIWNALRRLLVDDYSSLKQRLARRFGSADFASEVLHEAWMRLGRVDTSSSTAAVHNPKAYLYRIALNVATDRQRADKSWLDKIEIETLYRRAHEDLDPGRIVEARLELDALAKAINELPPRRRAVFISARLEHMPYKEIAEQHGITLRVVDRELKLALEYLSAVLKKNSIAGGGSDAPETS